MLLILIHGYSSHELLSAFISVRPYSKCLYDLYAVSLTASRAHFKNRASLIAKAAQFKNRASLIATIVHH